MALKIFRRKDSPSWWIRGSVCGAKIYRSTKLTDRHLAEALRIRIEFELMQESVFGPKAVKTFQQAIDSYLESGAPGRFLGAIEQQLSGKLLKDIQQNDLDQAARTLYPNTQPQTRNRQVYTPYIAVWNHAVRAGWADVRQWARPRRAKGTNFVRPAARRAGAFPVEYEHAVKFVAALSPGPAMLMTTLFYTGLRPIEAFTLGAEQVNVVGQWITLTNTKTGEPRGVPVHEFLVPLFQALAERGSALFRTHKGLPYKPKGDGGGQLKTAIEGARRRSGIVDISPYTARHTVSTGLVVAGVHPHIKDQILGHAADDMSRHYTNVPQAPLIEAINRLPVPALWRSLPWWEAPLAWSAKLAEGDRKTQFGSVGEMEGLSHV